ncbi:hypothetical protein WDW86_05595 [Bdellovibrionota bacterium FG-2]
MSLTKPYYQLYRHGPADVVRVFENLKKRPQGIHYLSSYELLKSDLREIFTYIEPSEVNLNTYSHRTFELLIRACTEVESHCKFVMQSNGYVFNKREGNIVLYSELERIAKLSEYEVLSYGFAFPPFRPFKTFSNIEANLRSPNWYKAYNLAKHSRLDNFCRATLGNLIEAVGAVYVLLVAQYGLGFDHYLRFSNEGFQQDMPTFFRVKDFPQWEPDENYVFSGEPEFARHPYIERLQEEKARRAQREKRCSSCNASLTTD